jgi:hypothetical protein
MSDDQYPAIAIETAYPEAVREFDPNTPLTDDDLHRLARVLINTADASRYDDTDTLADFFHFANHWSVPERVVQQVLTEFHEDRDKRLATTIDKKVEELKDFLKFV